MNITTPEIESIAKFQSLQSGQYWRSKRELQNLAIKEGMVLLIESIRWVDDKPHTIILRAHPDVYGRTICVPETREDGRQVTHMGAFKEYRFLLDEFLEKFEYEPDHQLIRNQELQQVQGVISDLQKELMEAQTNPALLAGFVESELQKEAEAKKGGEKDADKRWRKLRPDAYSEEAHRKA